MGPIVTDTDTDMSIYYKFKEKEEYENKIINVDDFLSEMESSISTNISYDNSETDSSNDFEIYNNNFTPTVLENHYSINYNVKELSQIMDYYSLSRKNLRKDEIIQIIVFFETDSTNIDIVERRRKMWRYITELKQDKYFSKYILCTF